MKLPWVKELCISPKGNKGHIGVKHDTSPELIENIINSDLPKEAKEWQIMDAKREIKFSLAGIAGEIINMNFKDKSKEALITFYKKEKKNENSDLFKAVAFNVIIGGQRPEDGALPLLPLLEETVNNLMAYWNNVIEVATLLQKDKKIGEDKLETIIEQWQQKLL
jgi:hypothetical protein